mmetsp:Transcript_33393/g.68966  ORF Transcript_33393/g.68966 Transcript_33393/m.68966 type:complete len:559 (+) Transcript_33393:751-2427(+)
MHHARTEPSSSLALDVGCRGEELGCLRHCLEALGDVAIVALRKRHHPQALCLRPHVAQPLRKLDSLLEQLDRERSSPELEVRTREVAQAPEQCAAVVDEAGGGDGTLQVDDALCLPLLLAHDQPDLVEQPCLERGVFRGAALAKLAEQLSKEVVVVIPEEILALVVLFRLRRLLLLLVDALERQEVGADVAVRELVVGKQLVEVVLQVLPPLLDERWGQRPENPVAPHQLRRRRVLGLQLPIHLAEVREAARDPADVEGCLHVDHIGCEHRTLRSARLRPHDARLDPRPLALELQLRSVRQPTRILARVVPREGGMIKNEECHAQLPRRVDDAFRQLLLEELRHSCALRRREHGVQRVSLPLVGHPLVHVDERHRRNVFPRPRRLHFVRFCIRINLLVLSFLVFVLVFLVVLVVVVLFFVVLVVLLCVQALAAPGRAALAVTPVALLALLACPPALPLLVLVMLLLRPLSCAIHPHVVHLRDRISAESIRRVLPVSLRDGDAGGGADSEGGVASLDRAHALAAHEGGGEARGRLGDRLVGGVSGGGVGGGGCAVEVLP